MSSQLGGMLVTRGPVRAGSLVGVGPSGSPPAGLRAFEAVDADPTGVLARPAGSVVFLRTGLGYWVNVTGTSAGWIAGHLMSTAAWTALLAIAASYAAGWRPGEIVHDAAFNGASVTVAGLSATKRYRIAMRVNDNGVLESVRAVPGPAAGTNRTGLVLSTGVVVYNTAGLALIRIDNNGGNIITCHAIIEPRRDGRSSFGGFSMGAAALTANESMVGSGYTDVDFTELVFVVSATARAGWLKVIEESP